MSYIIIDKVLNIAIVTDENVKDFLWYLKSNIVFFF